MNIMVVPLVSSRTQSNHRVPTIEGARNRNRRSRNLTGTGLVKRETIAVLRRQVALEIVYMLDFRIGL